MPTLPTHRDDLQTFDGIDSCGERLAAEIQAKVKAHPSLHKITFIGHSMGGLLVRYAAGTCLQRRNAQALPFDMVHSMLMSKPLCTNHHSKLCNLRLANAHIGTSLTHITDSAATLFAEQLSHRLHNLSS